jgi:chitodextrinase
MRTLTGVNATSFTDTGLEPSVQYHYKIRAVGNSGRSNYTPAAATEYLVISTTDDNTNPSVPQNLTATATAINTITLKWQASTDNTGIRQYRITYGAQTVSTGSSATTHVISGLNLNTNYTFTVRAEDLGGNLSAASNSASANTFVTGLYYEHSTGAWTDLDAINWNIAEFSGKVPNFTLAPRTQEDYFNFKFDGYLYIRTGGTYQFSTISSDGSRVEVNGTVVVENDGLHGNKTVTGPTLSLSGGAKRIIVKFFEYDGAQSLTVRYKGPDTGNSWINIPDNALSSSATSSSTLMARADSDTTAMEEPAEAMDISVYPNPTSPNDINILVESGSAGDAPLLVRVMDFTGRPVYQGTFMLDELRGGVRVTPDATLPDGLYVVIVQEKDKVQKKIIAIKN